MTGYVPTTEEVRASANWGAFTERDEFDAWLAEVIRAAREEGWDVGHKAHPYFGVNPYRKKQQ